MRCTCDDEDVALESSVWRANRRLRAVGAGMTVSFGGTEYWWVCMDANGECAGCKCGNGDVTDNSDWVSGDGGAPDTNVFDDTTGSPVRAVTVVGMEVEVFVMVVVAVPSSTPENSA